jgi:hypothetical protein
LPPLWCIWFMWLMANRKPHITLLLLIYGFRNDASRNGKRIYPRIFNGNFIWVFLATIPGLILSVFNFQRLWKKGHKFMELMTRLFQKTRKKNGF